MDHNGDVLNSWKEISQYVGRGVRTVQRWERDFGLPVRRPAGHVKSCVIALRSDIDHWMASRDLRTNSKQNGNGSYCEQCTLLRAQVEVLERELAALRARCDEQAEPAAAHLAHPHDLDPSQNAA